jgi:hypothetical protein
MSGKQWFTGRLVSLVAVLGPQPHCGFTAALEIVKVAQPRLSLTFGTIHSRPTCTKVSRTTIRTMSGAVTLR